MFYPGLHHHDRQTEEISDIWLRLGIEIHWIHLGEDY